MDKKRCPKGYRKDPETGECVKMSEELIKHKQSLRNKKKGVIFDEKGQKIKPAKYTQKKRVSLDDAIDESLINQGIDALIHPENEVFVDEVLKPKEPKGEPEPEEKEVEEKEPDGGEPEEKEESKEESKGEPEEKDESKDESKEESKGEPEEEEPEEEEDEEEEDEVLEPPKQMDIDTSNRNDFLLKKEELEAEDARYSTTNLYPTLNDPNFSYKIAQRQEFANTKYDGSIEDIRKQSDILCNAPFELLPHQLFVKNFLSFQTPYNSLLLYHGLGSGKTCSAIGIAEEMRDYMKQMGFTKKIIIVASPNVQDNFQLQLFDERKLKLLPDGTWNLNTCVGNALLKEINPTNLKGLTKERISSQIRTLIKTYYTFMGDKGEFANYIKKVIHIPEDAGLNEKERAELRKKKIKFHFNNRLIIIDEIHNIRISDSNKTKMTYVLLDEVVKKSDNLRLLLLSATPLYNSYSEIIWLTNLLNANDNRGLIKEENVFNSDGTFKEGGRELLVRKLTGYISYVRGENPYTFPYRIYPAQFDQSRTLKQYPSVQMNKIPIEEPLKYAPVYKDTIGEYQAMGYHFIMKYLGLKSSATTDKNGKTRLMPTFENMEKFGYTLLLAPLESLIMVYPNKRLDDAVTERKVELLESTDDAAATFPEEESRNIIKSIIGKTGLFNIMKYKTILEPVPKRFQFDYHGTVLKRYGEIFAPDNIHKYSSKIANICDILRRPSKGIVLIYSQYIDGGIVPMTLALESMGFSRYASTKAHQTNLLKTPKEQIDSRTLKPRSQVPKGEFKPAKYVIISGDKHFSQNNNDDIKYITNSENKNGELVKVVLISKAASEGLDFKNIRQVHILEPWYNMNRIEQIIGRGARNLSHCGLPFEERNVEIYLHGVVLDEDEESADMYVYRSAEKKAIQIGQVTRLMKEVSVDCLLNIEQTNFTAEKLAEMIENQNIEIELSSGGSIQYQIGDKPYTELCDYMGSCTYTSASETQGSPTEVEMIQNTQEENFVKTNSDTIMKRVRDLFLEKMVYKREHLINAVNIVKKYPIEHIHYALTRFINSETEELLDKYGRTGHLVSRGEYYAFQPNEVLDPSISTFERNVPVDFKHESIKLELPKEIRKLDEISQLKREPSIEEPSLLKRSYDDILLDISNNVFSILKKQDLKVKASDKNWYKHANKVLNELMVIHGMPENLINKYVLYHFLDYLPLQDKLTLASHIYDIEVKTGTEIIIKMYFDELLLINEDENSRALLLFNGKENVLYVESEGDWVKGAYTDYKDFESLRSSKFSYLVENINPTEIGFMQLFKSKDMSFKIKDMTQKRNNKGAKCEDASKPVIAKKIGIVLNEPNIYAETSIEKPELCVILEVLMRWIHEKNMTSESKGKAIFFGIEQAQEMDVSNIRIS